MQTITISLKDKTQELNYSGPLEKATTFLAIGPGFYGYGESLKSARENCVNAGCPRKVKMVSYLGDDSIGVDDFGMIHAKVCMFKLGEI